ncbi:glycoside hydrolase family 130 protein [Mucilaginibacter ginkgonis]|uniref:Glycoside hydrolase family 130 protein n=1 Tax=Mucilaginibacter ginkgonis TaxID=2682091 RepID=A0A6I4HZH4_9SPHI|nr:glycoside hydrolase family 130 protein [Mucilaginibacter ginkgonis]QQL48622.1 glycoside hydrolase family 130 protein [Mucilaginibacter ginkgonis]
MKDIAKRFAQNPILRPADLKPSAGDMQIICLLNPGVFTFKGKTWLIVRVAENTAAKEGFVLVPVINDAGQIEILEIPDNHPELISTDARVLRYQGLDYLTTLSHLRLLSSDDGVHFKEDPEYPPLFGSGMLETFGIEDCRVTQIGETYYLTYTAVSANGVTVGLRTTTDWKTFDKKGVIFPPHNKDCAIFEEKVNGLYYALHRPSSVDLGGNFIWIADSPDGVHWGNHKCIVKTRAGHWDSARVGAGAAPIKTEYGWLEIYHGATPEHQYCLGAVLLDLKDPSKVIARSNEPLMIPTEQYETSGFFGNVVFTNGHVVNGDDITLYYGAADEFVCGAHFSIKEIVVTLYDHQSVCLIG